jgi:hypothetical protein
MPKDQRTHGHGTAHHPVAGKGNQHPSAHPDKTDCLTEKEIFVSIRDRDGWIYQIASLRMASLSITSLSHIKTRKDDDGGERCHMLHCSHEVVFATVSSELKTLVSRFEDNS